MIGNRIVTLPLLSGAMALNYMFFKLPFKYRFLNYFLNVHSKKNETFTERVFNGKLNFFVIIILQPQHFPKPIDPPKLLKLQSEFRKESLP